MVVEELHGCRRISSGIADSYLSKYETTFTSSCDAEYYHGGQRSIRSKTGLKMIPSITVVPFCIMGNNATRENIENELRVNGFVRFASHLSDRLGVPVDKVLDAINRFVYSLQEFSILTYPVPHKIPHIDELLGKAKHVAEFAVTHKLKEDERYKKFMTLRQKELDTFRRKNERNNPEFVNKKDKEVVKLFDEEQVRLGKEIKFKRRLLSSKDVKHFGLPGTISCQVLRKYGRGTIKKAQRVNLIIPGQAIRYEPINSLVTIGVLNKYKFKWNPGRPIIKINQIEINRTKISITFTVRNAKPRPPEERHVVGVDLNATHHIAVIASLSNNKVVMMGKKGPNIRKKYFKKRQKAQKEKNFKMLKGMSGGEKRITKNIDHQISSDIVKLAVQTKSKVVIEDLTGIKNRVTKGNGSNDHGKSGSKTLNRLVNNWSFFRLGKFIEYKCQLAGIPFEKVAPNYTSQLCSYCGVRGKRDRKEFVCTNKACNHRGVGRHADVNAAFNIARRGVQEL